ncbi:uncharacterized protein [Primulina eburnea]|uniref:uncharacterized protein n=1 Tax=Primulina eburnea TaxID=1245227 RepID=UPI003C6C3459
MQLIIYQFQELRPPKFFGNKSGEKAAGWLKSINNLFNLLEYSQDIRLKLSIYQLKDRAQLWWEATEEAMKDSSEIVTWDAFRAHFTQEYAPPSYYAAKEEEFNQLVQGNKSVVEYASQFYALLPYVPHVAKKDQAKLSHFLHGFQWTVHTLVMTGSPNTYIQAVEKAKKIEASLLREDPQPGPSSVSQGSGSSMSMPVDLPTYQPVQSYQQPKQRRYKAKGKQFKKKSQSNSSSSGSARGGGSVGSSNTVHCARCGGRYFSSQCVGVQGSYYVCGQVGHCQNTGASHSFLSAAFFDEHEIATIPLLDTVSVATLAGCCQLAIKDFFIYALDAIREERLKVLDILVFKDFLDVFLDEIPGFLPQREIDLSIELMPGTNPISRAPYRLAPTELVLFLGHVISAQGVSVDLSKVEAVINWPKPTNVSEIRSFLGLAGCYWRFIEGFSRIARPMIQLTQKDRRLYQPGRMNQVADALSRKVQPKMLASLTISKTDGQSERTIQTLEDMLRAVVMDFSGGWQESLSLVEFSYNNSFQATIGMTPFEALYGRKCRSLICSEDVGERHMSLPEFIQEMKDKVEMIRKRMKAA